MSNLKKIITTTICKYVNEEQEVENNLNDNFWKWFGNSVTIKNNSPIIFYHGTDTDFKSFDKNKIGSKHWRSKSDAYGGGFFFVDKERYTHKHGIIKEVYLKIEKPYLTELEDMYGYEVDYYHAVDKFDLNSTTHFQIAKENGNDGIIIKTPRGGLYIVFEPNQIKSVDNDGTWDIDDDNMYS
jgi:hypothetical protein